MTGDLSVLERARAVTVTVTAPALPKVRAAIEEIPTSKPLVIAASLVGLDLVRADLATIPLEQIVTVALVIDGYDEVLAAIADIPREVVVTVRYQQETAPGAPGVPAPVPVPGGPRTEPAPPKLPPVGGPGLPPNPTPYPGGFPSPTPYPGPMAVTVHISALDGADVERVVRSDGFRQALTSRRDRE